MYNCYYHPKTSGSNSCLGCKLPVCAGCEGETGYCPECTRKRNAVGQLRELRQAMANKKATIASTTQRLRLAIRQMGPGKPVTVATPSAPAARSQMLTRPLPADIELPRPVVAPAAMNGVPQSPRKARRRSTGPGWSYDPDKLAYRAPENLHEVNRQARKVPKSTRYGTPAHSTNSSAHRGMMAMAVGFIITLIVGIPAYQMVFAKPAPQVKDVPLYTPLTAEEKAIVQHTLAQQPAHKHVVNLPEATLDAPTAPSTAADDATYDRSPVYAEAHKVARGMAPVAVRFHGHAALSRAYAARAYAAPVPHRTAYAAPAAHWFSGGSRQSSLTAAMHFSGPGAASAYGGNHHRAGSFELIHW